MSLWKNCPHCDARFALQASLNDHLKECRPYRHVDRIAELEAFKLRVERAHTAWMEDKASIGDAMTEVGRALIEIEVR